MAGRLKHKTGDLFDTTLPIVAHQVNCSGGFASGVAGQVARRFPDVKRAYHEKFRDDGWELGQVQILAVDHPTIQLVANLAGQQEYGREPGRVYVDYGGLARALDTLLAFASHAEMGVAVPRLGCGLAGGDWTRVEAILRDAVATRGVEVEVWTPPRGYLG